MIAIAPPPRRFQAYWALGLPALVLPFYLVYLFGVGVFTALVSTSILLGKRLRMMITVGGGFTSLAAWFTIQLHCRDQYDWVVNLVSKFLDETWATVAVDTVICGLAALLFVSFLSGTKKTAKSMVMKLRKSPVKDDEANAEA